MKKIILFVSIGFISCIQQGQDLGLSKGFDYRISNVFTEDNYNELLKTNSKLTSSSSVINEDYTHYSYISLKSDNSYTFLLGNQYMFGTYQLKPEELILKPKTGKEIHLKVNYSNANSIQIHGDFEDFKSDYLVIADGKSSFYINLRPEKNITDNKNDIRSETLNEWRLKPAQPETDEQIKKRLINNLEFIAAYMNVNRNSDREVINIRGIKSPFRHAANGIVLNYWNEVDNFWKLIFFDENDAEKAFKMVKAGFDEPMTIPENVGWIELNEVLIRQLINTIEKQ